MLKKNKRGEILFPTFIFIVLNLIFFLSLLVFVSKASTGTLVYEQAYAKEIALMLDNAKPGMQIKIDFENGLKVAEKNNYAAGKLVEIKDNFVIVRLGSNGGYKFGFFTNYDADVTYEDKFVVLNVKEHA